MYFRKPHLTSLLLPESREVGAEVAGNCGGDRKQLLSMPGEAEQ